LLGAGCRVNRVCSCLVTESVLGAWRTLSTFLNQMCPSMNLLFLTPDAVAKEH
jgi:hypothetical protein